MTDNIENTTVLSGHTSADTAHLTFAYPYGRRLKCVRREWVEFGTKGAARGQQRFVTQTTHPTFNRQYSTIIASQGQEAADTWAEARIAAGGVPWNAEKAATYSTVVVLIQTPLADESGRIGTSSLALSPYSNSERIAQFKALTQGKLDAEQERNVATLEAAQRAQDERRERRNLELATA